METVIRGRRSPCRLSGSKFRGRGARSSGWRGFAHPHDDEVGDAFFEGRSRSMRRTWSRISPIDRLRFTPLRPLAQKMQPMAQPTWELTQMVRRSSSRMRTVSICSPSRRVSRSFSVPSFETWWRVTSEAKKSKCSFSRARRRAGTSCISSKEFARRPKIQRRIWSPGRISAPARRTTARAGRW